MTISLRHSKVSNVPDDGDPNIIQPSDWNDEHDLTVAQDRILGRVSSGTGSVEELTQAQLVTFLGSAAVSDGDKGDITVSGSGATWTIDITTTRGDIIRRGASANERLALGTSGYALLSDGTDAVWGGFTQAGTGAVTRTWQDKMRDIVSVLDFIPTALHANIKSYTSTDDVSSYITAAIATFDSAKGGRLYFPSGKYRVGSAITIDKPGHFYGDWLSTIVETNSATANIFTVTASEVLIDGFRFQAGTRTGGYYVEFTASRCRLQRFYMIAPYYGIGVTNGNSLINIEHGEIRNTVATNGIAINLTDVGGDVTIRDITHDASAQCAAGIKIINALDVTIEDCNILHAGTGLHILPNSGDTVATVWVSNSFFDSCTRGLLIDSVNGGNVVRCTFDEAWFSSCTNEGVLLTRASGAGVLHGLSFNGCSIFLNGTDGIKLNTTAIKGVSISDSAIAGNTSAGVSVAANVSDFSVSDSRIGAYDGIPGNAYGLFIAAGTTNNYVLTDNSILGNTTANVSNGATGTVFIAHNNLGYYPATNGQIMVGQTSGVPAIKSVSGDATLSETGALTIANGAVTYAKMQDVSATDKLLGRSTAGSGDVEEITCTAFARSILDDADEATFKATVNLEIGTDVQAYDATLASLSALGTAADKIAYTTGIDTWAETAITSFARSILDDANEATFKATVNLEIGTDVQAYDATLQSLSALGTASDKLAYTTGIDTWAEASLTSFGRSLIGASTAQAAQQNLNGWYVLAASAVQVTRASVNGAGDATETTLATVTIPANSIGANGCVRVTCAFDCNDSANSKTYRIRFNGSSGTSIQAATVTTSAAVRMMAIGHNRNATNSQIFPGAVAGTGGWVATTQHNTAAVNTTASVDLVFMCNWAGATAGETISLESYIVEVFYQA